MKRSVAMLGAIVVLLLLASGFMAADNIRLSGEKAAVSEELNKTGYEYSVLYRQLQTANEKIAALTLERDELMRELQDYQPAHTPPPQAQEEVLPDEEENIFSLIPPATDDEPLPDADSDISSGTDAPALTAAGDEEVSDDTVQKLSPEEQEPAAPAADDDSLPDDEAEEISGEEATPAPFTMETDAAAPESQQLQIDRLSRELEMLRRQVIQLESRYQLMLNHLPVPSETISEPTPEPTESPSAAPGHGLPSEGMSQQLQHILRNAPGWEKLQMMLEQMATE